MTFESRPIISFNTQEKEISTYSKNTACFLYFSLEAFP
jgi:hypothetical protein